MLLGIIYLEQILNGDCEGSECGKKNDPQGLSLTIENMPSPITSRSTLVKLWTRKVVLGLGHLYNRHKRDCTWIIKVLIDFVLIKRTVIQGRPDKIMWKTLNWELGHYRTENILLKIMYHVVRGAIRGICENSFIWLLEVALNRQIAKIQRPKTPTKWSLPDIAQTVQWTKLYKWK